MAVDLLIPQRLILFLVVVLLCVMSGGFAYAYLPKATVTVESELVDRVVQQDITLSANESDPDFVRFVLPAQVVEVAVTEDKFIERKAGEVFDDFARGEVVLINNQVEEQRLLPKSHLKHVETGVYFLTDEAAVIPPKDQIKMRVTAKEKGASGNILAGRLIVDRLPVSTQEFVYAESEQTFDGGVAVEKPLSEDEISRAREAVVAKAKERALAELTLKAGGSYLREDLTSFEENDVTISAQPGSRTIGFTARATIKARSFVADDNDLLSLTLLKLRDEEEAGQEFVTYDPKSFKARLKRSDFEQGQALVEGSLTGSFATKLGPAVFTGENLAGLSREEVIDKLQALPGVGVVKVDFSPFWVTTVPGRSEAVEVVVAKTNGS